MQQRILVVALMLVIFSQASAVSADEIGDLRELIQKQNEQLQKTQERLEILEASQMQ